MSTQKVLLGVPTGWHLSADWQASFMAWIGTPRLFELALHWARSNTKCCAYSELVDKAKEIDADYLWIYETNILHEVPIQKVYERISQFHCVFSPGRFTDGTYGLTPCFIEDNPDYHDLPVDRTNGHEEFLPIESRWGCTHFVSLDRKAYRALDARFLWTKANAKVDHDMPIYCYDGDTRPDHPDPYVAGSWDGNPHRRLAIEQSLFSNVRAHGVGVWAEPQLYTTNLRLGGYYQSFRLSQFDVPESDGTDAA